jgi:hypothetical protein
MPKTEFACKMLEFKVNLKNEVSKKKVPVIKIT